jgi:hypothetical protein
MEKIILVPGVVAAKARYLHERGCYKAAIEIISANKIEVTVYNRLELDERTANKLYSRRTE